MRGFYGEHGWGGSTSAPGGSSNVVYQRVRFVLLATFAIYLMFCGGGKNVIHTPFRAPQSRQMRFSPPPQAARVCRRAPGQSGKSWTCEDSRVAASQSEPSTGRPHWRHNREMQQLRVIENILQSDKKDMYEDISETLFSLFNLQ